MVDTSQRYVTILEALQHPVFVISTSAETFGEIRFANAVANILIVKEADLSAVAYNLQDNFKFLTCQTLANALLIADSTMSKSSHDLATLQFVQSIGSFDVFIELR